MIVGYKEVLELCEDDLFEVKPNTSKPTALTRWDKLSIYLVVPTDTAETAGVIIAKVQHRAPKLSNGMIRRFLRILVRAKAINEIPNLGDMRRVSYIRKGLMY